MISKNKEIVKQRVKVGKIVSDKMDKTVVVKVTRTVKHPLYKKTIKHFKKYKVHDSQNTGKVGDVIEIVECRPYSKTKHMKLKRIISNKQV